MKKDTYQETKGNAVVGVRAKKSLGQNFLLHQQTASHIADASGISKEDVVLEVGPGTGMLTRELLARAKKVIAIEADNALIPVLEETFAGEIAEGKLQLLQQDVRVFDTKTISGAYKVVANIPYYITGELIRQFLTAAHKPLSMTLLVQKEVAERIARAKKESILSLSVKAFGTPSFIFKVPRGAFIPAPNVDSAVLSITDINPNAFSPGEEERFFAVVKAGFAHKRKRLAKNLESLMEPKRAQEALEKAEIPPNARAEDLSLSDWKKLARILS